MRRWIVSIAAAVLTAQAWAQDAKKAEQLFAEGQAAEARGDGKAAVKAYIGAARSGSAAAAHRLSEIYDKGAPGVKADHAESQKWLYYGRSKEEQKGGWGCPPRCAK